MRRLSSAAMLTASLVAPATQAWADTSPKTLTETVGPRFRGIASANHKRRPFVVYDIKVQDGGNFEAAINWTSQGSIHKIRGSFKNGVLTFKETEAIQQGEAPLGCEYKIDTTRASSGQVEGQWGHCTGSSGYGTLLAFLPVPPPAAQKPDADKDLRTAEQITALADFVRQNCPGLGVDDQKLADFAKSKGTSAADARKGPLYQQYSSTLIPQDVAKYGRNRYCYQIQAFFFQPYTPINQIVFKY